MCTVISMQMNLKCFFFYNADFYEGDTRCVCFLLVTELLNVVQMNLKLRNVNICEFFGFWRDVFDVSLLKMWCCITG